jgi:hypothetical protein
MQQPALLASCNAPQPPPPPRDRSGKSAIILHFCHKLACQGKRVLLLCQRSRLENQPPVLPQGATRSDPAFRSIDIK